MPFAVIVEGTVLRLLSRSHTNGARATTEVGWAGARHVARDSSNQGECKCSLPAFAWRFQKELI